jgi:hypothetical protein
MHRRQLAALLLLCSAPTFALAQQHSNARPAPPANSPPKEATQFDFLVGQWALTVTPKVSSLAARIHGAPKLLGTWKAWRAFDGFGIEDELRIVDRSGNPSSLSHAMRVYNGAERRWEVTAVDVYRARPSAATAVAQNGEVVQSGRGVDSEGKEYLTRTRFFGITPTAFRYQQDRSSDGGRTWDDGVLKIEAKRVAASAPR